MNQIKSIATVAFFALLIIKSVAQGDFKRINTAADFNLYSIVFADSVVGYIGGANAAFLKTTDGGVTWNELRVRNAPWIFGKMDVLDLAFSNKDSGYAVIGNFDRKTVNSMIWRTTDGGVNWTLVKVTVNMVPWRINLISFDSGIVGGSAFFQGSVISSLSGDSVVNLESFSWDGGNFIEAIARHKENPNFIISVTNNSSVHRSFDGGLSWDTIQTTLDSGFRDLIHVKNDLWVATMGGIRSIQVTRDSGKTWAWVATTFAYPTYSSVSLSKRDSLVYAGYSYGFKEGDISYFYKGSQRTQSVPMRLHGSTCNETGDAFVVGDSGAIYRRGDNSTGLNRPRVSGSYFFPNPVQSKLKFRKPTEGKVKVFDSFGKLVLSQCAKGGSLDLGSLKVGHYVIKFQFKGSGELRNAKLLKTE